MAWETVRLEDGFLVANLSAALLRSRRCTVPRKQPLAPADVWTSRRSAKDVGAMRVVLSCCELWADVLV